MDLTSMVAIISVFGSFSFLVWVVTDTLRRRRQLQVAADFHTKLLDKMQSSRELSEFLDSPGGARFIDSVAMERSHPAHRILRAVQVGIVLLAAGIGCRLVGGQAVLHPEAVEGFTVLGILLMSVGIGYLFSAGISYGLSRSFGLFDEPSREAR
jgi:hypothetical protein